MTQKDYTHLIFVIDRSGSMRGSESDVNGGYDKLIEDQRALPGKCTVTTVQFDNEVETVCLNENIADVARFSLAPRGGTALLDAIGVTVAKEGERLAAMKENKRPSNVVVTIMTDGRENASREWTRDAVLALLKLQQETYNWKVVFVGADLGSVQYAQNLGIGTTAQYSAGNERKTYGTLSSAITRTRAGGAMAFTPDEQKTLIK